MIGKFAPVKEKRRRVTLVHFDRTVAPATAEPDHRDHLVLQPAVPDVPKNERCGKYGRKPHDDPRGR